MRETAADPERTVLFISAGFDACEHEHQGMQRHDRRVPASFYSRYTKDIAAFADKHVGGKVVSVLEGGYGDRALTSAALGHAIGMMGREGEPEWWSVDELDLLERAVKKRRKGKLCQLGPELAGKPHIARAHALLGHFEGSAPPQTPAPSTNATPQQQRRTLRERRPKVYDDDTSPAPTARRIRKPATSATQTPADTPRRRGPEAETPKRTPKPVPEARPEAVEVPPEIKAEVDSGTESTRVVDSGLGVQVPNVSLVYPSPAPSVSSSSPPETKADLYQSISHTSPPADPPADPPRIILRIPRLTPPAEAPGDQDHDDRASGLADVPQAAPAIPHFARPAQPAPGQSLPGFSNASQTFRPGVLEAVSLPPPFHSHSTQQQLRTGASLPLHPPGTRDGHLKARQESNGQQPPQ